MINVKGHVLFSKRSLLRELPRHESDKITQTVNSQNQLHLHCNIYTTDARNTFLHISALLGWLLQGVFAVVKVVVSKWSVVCSTFTQLQIISIVKPTRCTNVSNLFYFGITLYMFRAVFPSIIRSSRLYVQQPNRFCCLLVSGYPLASREQYLFGCCMYSLELLMMDGTTVRNM